MKSFLTLLVLLICFPLAQGQDQQKNKQKGKLYIYWGWNRAQFSNSDINFSGADYNFTLDNVVAYDRPSKFTLETYFKFTNLTQPQYNGRIGYFFKNNWDISIGVDHMKYVMQENQIVNINGDIATGSPYDGSYNDDNIVLANDFLMYEHTDGLNYVNFSIRRFDEIHKKGMFAINVTEGIGIGGLMPKTNTTLLGNERYDEFHWSGYGFDAMVGLNFTFWDVFFIQSEFKIGYINMPDVRTTASELDKASQSFSYSQFNVVFGGNFFHFGKN
jgi:hypothetical protein